MPAKSDAESIYRKSFFVNLLDPCNIMFPDSYVEELHSGHVGVENITTAPPWDDTKQTIEAFSRWLAFFHRHHDKLQQIEHFKDVTEARSTGKVGIILGLQGANCIGENLDLLQVFRKLGLRILAVAYQRRSVFADGSGEPKDSGLSKLGERLVEEANRLGIILDLSHAGRRTTVETMELSKDPVIFSHSNVKSICPSVRNVDDEQIKAVAEKGGIVGIAAYGPLLVKPTRRATMSDLLDHIDYIERLVGVDHVGLGLDVYPHTPEEFNVEFKRRFPEIAGSFPFDMSIDGLQSPAQWLNLVRALVERGYSETDIHKMVGQNALRVFETVWKD